MAEKKEGYTADMGEISFYKGLIALAVCCLGFYGPLLADNHFVSDDYSQYYILVVSPDWSSLLFGLNADHFTPLRMAFSALQHWAFGSSPAGYYFVNVCLHASAVVLLGLLTRLVFRHDGVALSAAVLFGFSAAHWKVPMWIITQGQLLAANFFVLCLLYGLKFFHGGQLRWLFVSLILHLAMLLAFSSGVIVPLVYFGLAWFALPQRARREAPRRGALCAALGCVNILAVVVFRHVFHPTAPSLLDRLAERMPLLERAAVGAIAATSSALYQIGGSYFGLLMFNEAQRKLVLCSVIVLCLLCALSVPWRSSFVRSRAPLALLFLFAAWFMYYVPSFVRVEHGFRFLFERSRFAYLPGLLTAPVFALGFWSLLARWKSDNYRLRVWGLCGFAVAVLIVNVVSLKQREAELSGSATALNKAAQQYLETLDAQVAAQGHIAVKNISFDSAETHLAGWNVDAEKVCYTMRTVDYCRRITFHAVKN